MIDARGNWIRGWRVDGKEGEPYHCAVLCDRLAPDYARRRIADELKTKPYRCRFIDTTTASPWRECYAPDHPLTRSESKRWKMELLDVVSREFKLVTGCETGHEASVPYLHYFEGMLSLGPYRVKDAGRRMADVVDEVPEQVAKFQTGHLLPAAAVGTGLSRLHGGAVVLGRLQQQAAQGVGPPRPVERPVRHAAHVPLRPQGVGGEPRAVRARAIRRPRRWPGRPATARCSRTPGSPPITRCSRPGSPTAWW